MTATAPTDRVVAQPPVQRSRYTTSDPEDGTESVRSRYGHDEPSCSRPEDFSIDVVPDAVTSTLGSVRIDRLRHLAGAGHAEAEPQDELVAASGIGGQLRLSDRGGRAGGVVLLPTWDRYRAAVWEDMDLLVCTLHPDTVRRVGAELSGLAPDAVSFRATTAVSPERARAFAALLAHAERDLLAHDEVMASPSVRAETVRHLATMMLLTFPNTVLDALTDPAASGPDDAEPATVRRAVAFVDDHAHHPIGLADIAAAAGIGQRGLQTAFRRYRDSTPLEYLRRVRLERAHRDLQVGDPTRGDTVAAVAARWGFTHPGRFSLGYRRVYGCSPSHTLRD